MAKRVGFDYGGSSKKNSHNNSKRDYYDDYGDDYYYGGSYGSKHDMGFNWGMFGSYSLQEDDDSKLFVKSHEGYFTPKNNDISWRFSDFRQNTESNRDLIKELSRFFYFRMVGDDNYFDERFDDLTTLTTAELEELIAKQEFYDSLWDKFIPGYTPLEKALSVFEELSRTQGKHEKFNPNHLKLGSGSVKFDEEVYMNPEFNELLDMKHFEKKRKLDILNKLSFMKNLGSEFKVEKEIDEHEVQNSRLITKRIMRSFSQIGNIDLYQRLMPTFSVKLLMKDLIVNVPVEKTEHKQRIIILLDFSGSMDEARKQDWVVAILVDRLRYVMRGEAEIYFSYFNFEIDELEFHHIHDRESVFTFWKGFSTRPNGGETNLGSMVQYVGDQISQGKLHNLDVDLRKEKPEILAINDGNDSIKTDGFTYKTNAISLMRSNSELQKLCVKNDGKYVTIDEAGNAKTYSKSGEIAIKTN